MATSLAKYRSSFLIHSWSRTFDRPQLLRRFDHYYNQCYFIYIIITTITVTITDSIVIVMQLLL